MHYEGRHNCATISKCENLTFMNLLVYIIIMLIDLFFFLFQMLEKKMEFSNVRLRNYIFFNFIYNYNYFFKKIIIVKKHNLIGI